MSYARNQYPRNQNFQTHQQSNDDELPDEPPFKAFLKNLPYTMVQGDIEALMESIGGKVRGIHMFRDKESHKFIGSAIVEFETRNDLINALKCDGALFDGNTLGVSVANQRGRGRGRGSSNRPSRMSGGQNYPRRAYNDSDFSQRGPNSNRYERNNMDRRQINSDRGQTRPNFTDASTFRENRRYEQTMEPPVSKQSSRDDPARPRIKLAPRTVKDPIGQLADTFEKSDIFGKGKPRESSTHEDTKS